MNTKRKIQLATAVYRMISLARGWFGKGDLVEIRRGGYNWALDLHEGIDFSIFLLGGFEPRTLRLYRKLLGRQEGEIVLDIGANIGAHTLPLAKLVACRSGKVYAFEPTDYAYKKLLKNITLNPMLEKAVVPIQAMLIPEDGNIIEQEIYSSWPLKGESSLHTVHGGQLKTTSGSTAITLDSFVRIYQIERIDFIKLDVDGHESEVLAGAWESLERFHPKILMEWCPYLFAERPDAMSRSLHKLLNMGYRMFDASSGEYIPGSYVELNRRTSSKGSMNILLC